VKGLGRRLEKLVLGLGVLSGRRGVRASVIGTAVLVAVVATSVGAYHVAPRTIGHPQLADATADSPSASPSASASPSDSIDVAGGGGKNIVQVSNKQDGRLLVDGRVQLNTIPAPRVAPVNIAGAFSSCTDCQTVALAFQVSLYKIGAPYVTPQNAAVAVNYACTRCVTIAVAKQWVIPVDDPTNPPQDARAMVTDMNRELAGMRSRQTSAGEAITAIDDVVNRYNNLVGFLTTKTSTATDSTTPGATASPPTPSPDSASPSPDATGVSPTPTSSPTAQSQPTPTPSPSDSPSPGPSP
jgi:putative peptide zinc metalloprotease protein